MKQTAVEWLYNEIKHIIPNDYIEKFNQAKEMEEEQHKNTWFYSTSQFDNSAEMKEYTKKTFEQYYNEKFKNK